MTPTLLILLSENSGRFANERSSEVSNLANYINVTSALMIMLVIGWSTANCLQNTYISVAGVCAKALERKWSDWPKQIIRQNRCRILIALTESVKCARSY